MIIMYLIFSLTFLLDQEKWKRYSFTNKELKKGPQLRAFFCFIKSVFLKSNAHNRNPDGAANLHF